MMAIGNKGGLKGRIRQGNDMFLSLISLLQHHSGGLQLKIGVVSHFTN